MALYHDNFESSLSRDLAGAKQSVAVISPYVTGRAVKALLKATAGADLERVVVTLPFGPEYVTGMVEAAALEQLAQAGWALRSLERLHSKLYVIDRAIAYIGSANLTGKGWGLAGADSNVEAMTRIKLSAADIREIEALYLNRARPLAVTEEMKRIVAECEELRESLRVIEDKLGAVAKIGPAAGAKPTRYDEWLEHMRSSRAIVSYVKAVPAKEFGVNVYRVERSREDTRHAKLMFSVMNGSSRTVKEDYNYELSAGAGKLAMQRNLDFVMIVGNSTDDGQWRYVALPADFMKKHVLLSRYLNRKTDSWQFAVSVDYEGELLLRCFSAKTGVPKLHKISGFENAWG